MALSLSTILNLVRDTLDIEVLGSEDNLEKIFVNSNSTNVLGLELNGYFEGLPEAQIQIIDTKGMKFLKSLKSDKFSAVLTSLFSYQIPGIIFTDSNKPSSRFMDLAESNQIPIMVTDINKIDFLKEFERKLNELLAPRMDYRGTMMEVYGLGVLITGKSNVGKSECAIDLLQRGHRMIGDDIVEVTKRGPSVIIAQGKFPISHRMELRGIGIIDVIELFGVSAVKNVEKIEFIIELEKWNADKNYERLGFEEKYIEILGVQIPYIVIPVAPGRNTAIMVEVASMNHRLRRRGIIPAQELEREVLDSYKK